MPAECLVFPKLNGMYIIQKLFRVKGELQLGKALTQTWKITVILHQQKQMQISVDKISVFNLQTK